jgi:hypothetical protein
MCVATGGPSGGGPRCYPASQVRDRVSVTDEIVEGRCSSKASGC